MALLKEQERICRERGNPKGLARALANQASLLGRMNRPGEALPLAEEAYRLASQHGLTALVQWLGPILDRLQGGG